MSDTVLNIDGDLEKASEEFQEAHSKFLATVKANEAQRFLSWWLMGKGYDGAWVEQAVKPLYNEYNRRNESKQRDEDSH